MKKSDFENTITQVPFAVLNIGGGKEHPLFKNKLPSGSIIVNLDRKYISSSSVDDILPKHEKLIENPDEVKLTKKKFNVTYQNNLPSTRVYYLDMNITQFLKEYYYKFDIICMYNFLERVPREKTYNFFNLIYSNLKYNGYLDIIFRDFHPLSSNILEFENRGLSEDIARMQLYEKLFGSPDKPHRSVWTSEKLLKILRRFNINAFGVEEDDNFNKRVIGIKEKKNIFRNNLDIYEQSK